MGFWSRLFAAFREPSVPKHPAIVALEARRNAYVIVVRETAVSKTVHDAALERAEDLERAAAVWETRSELELPDDIQDAAETLARRLRASATAARELVDECAESMSEAADTIEAMAVEDLRLMQRARALGLDVQDLTVVLDGRELRKNAEDRLHRALRDAGALDPDEDRDFLERLFDGMRLRTTRAPLHS